MRSLFDSIKFGRFGYGCYYSIKFKSSKEEKERKEKKNKQTNKLNDIALRMQSNN